MMDHVKKIVLTPKYSVQNLADTFSVDEFCLKILFLPVAHPIEMLWGHVKTEAAKSNSDLN